MDFTAEGTGTETALGAGAVTQENGAGTQALLGCRTEKTRGWLEGAARRKENLLKETRSPQSLATAPKPEEEAPACPGPGALAAVVHGGRDDARSRRCIWRSLCPGTWTSSSLSSGPGSGRTHTTRQAHLLLARRPGGARGLELAFPCLSLPAFCLMHLVLCCIV